MEPGKITYRRAEEKDLASIIRLLADDALGRTREDPSLPPAPAYRDAFRAIADDPNQLLAVATEIDGTIVGTLQITFVPGLSRRGAWRGQIEAVRIAPSHRNSGVGQAMFSWAIEVCRKKGCALVQLTTDKTRPEAHRFYEKLGFEGSHIGYKLDLTGKTEPGVDGGT